MVEKESMKIIKWENLPRITRRTGNDWNEMPFELLLLILSFLPVRDRQRCSRVNKSFNSVNDYIWFRVKEIPSGVSLNAIPLILPKTCNLELFDCSRFKALLSIPLAKLLAASCPSITFFRKIREEDLFFVNEYDLQLKESKINKISVMFEDWSETSSVSLLVKIFEKTPSLKHLHLINNSYTQLQENEDVWSKIGNRLESLIVSCEGIFNTVSVLKPGDKLLEFNGCLSQQDFDHLCSQCPNIRTLKDLSFVNEKLPNPVTLLAIEADGFSTNDVLIDISLLMSLKNIQVLHLTSLVCRESRILLKHWLSRFGHQLSFLDLNLTNGDVSVIDSIIEHCSSLLTLNLFVSRDDVIVKYGTIREFFDVIQQFTDTPVRLQREFKGQKKRQVNISISPKKTCNSTSF